MTSSYNRSGNISSTEIDFLVVCKPSQVAFFFSYDVRSYTHIIFSYCHMEEGEEEVGARRNGFLRIVL